MSIQIREYKENAKNFEAANKPQKPEKQQMAKKLIKWKKTLDF